MPRFAPLLALAAIGIATPAVAEGPSRADLRNGRCTVQQVHTPAGKMVHSAPIVRCATRDTEIAVREKPAQTPDTRPTGHD